MFVPVVLSMTWQADLRRNGLGRKHAISHRAQRLCAGPGVLRRLSRIEVSCDVVRRISGSFRHVDRSSVLMTAVCCRFSRVVLRGGAELPAVVKVGILNDMNGPFADQSGEAPSWRRELAAEDFAATGGGLAVRIISADHQNKADIGAQIAREWVDRDGVAAVADSVNSRSAWRSTGDGGEAPHLRRDECRNLRPHREVLPADHGAVDDGHLCAGQRDRSGDDGAAWRYLVLHRLRLRTWRGSRT